MGVISVKEIMAPTFKSLFGHPSRRFPIPVAKELSTVEWQNAQVIPNDLKEPDAESNAPLIPTTAFSFSRASVVAGLFRSTVPLLLQKPNQEEVPLHLLLNQQTRP